jgi:hypothetical protein
MARLTNRFFQSELEKEIEEIKAQAELQKKAAILRAKMSSEDKELLNKCYGYSL